MIDILGKMLPRWPLGRVLLDKETQPDDASSDNTARRLSSPPEKPDVERWSKLPQQHQQEKYHHHFWTMTIFHRHKLQQHTKNTTWWCRIQHRPKPICKRKYNSQAEETKHYHRQHLWQQQRESRKLHWWDPKGRNIHYRSTWNWRNTKWQTAHHHSKNIIYLNHLILDYVSLYATGLLNSRHM